MTDLTFEAYWQQVDAEIERIFGHLGGDVIGNGDQIADCFRAGATPSRAALNIGAERGLMPRP